MDSFTPGQCRKWKVQYAHTFKWFSSFSLDRFGGPCDDYWIDPSELSPKVVYRAHCGAGLPQKPVMNKTLRSNVGTVHEMEIYRSED